MFMCIIFITYFDNLGNFKEEICHKYTAIKGYHTHKKKQLKRSIMLTVIIIELYSAYIFSAISIINT